MTRPTMPTDQEIGARVRALRGSRPQRSLAISVAMLGGPSWTQDTVTRVETGKRPLRLNEAVIVASVLGVPLMGLIADEGLKSNTAAALRELRDLSRHIDKRITELRES